MQALPRAAALLATPAAARARDRAALAHLATWAPAPLLQACTERLRVWIKSRPWIMQLRTLSSASAGLARDPDAAVPADTLAPQTYGVQGCASALWKDTALSLK